MTKWQPIETAPRDWTKVVGYDGNIAADINWSGIVIDGPRWWVCHNDILSSMSPTHWMPLPEPPASDQ